MVELEKVKLNTPQIEVPLKSEANSSNNPSNTISETMKEEKLVSPKLTLVPKPLPLAPTLLTQPPPQSKEDAIICYKDYCKLYYANMILTNQVFLKFLTLKIAEDAVGGEERASAKSE